jgi:hypothetical protein
MDLWLRKSLSSGPAEDFLPSLELPSFTASGAKWAYPGEPREGDLGWNHNGLNHALSWFLIEGESWDEICWDDRFLRGE